MIVRNIILEEKTANAVFLLKIGYNRSNTGELSKGIARDVEIQYQKDPPITRKKEYGKTIIAADGGIKYSGDIVKALAAGVVMLIRC